MSKEMTLDTDGVMINVVYSHTETHWKGKINIYDVEVGDNINFRFLDNFNRNKYREDLIVKGVLKYIVDSFYDTRCTPLAYLLSKNLTQDWIDSIDVYLKLQQANMG
jgi:hypothetical protein